MLSKDKRIESLKSDLRRCIRLYPREILADKIIECVLESYVDGEEQKAPIFKMPSNLLNHEKVITLVLSHYAITSDQLYSRNRKREAVYVRMVAMYLVWMRCRLSYSTIGRMFGGFDHSTVIHACNTISDLIHQDMRVRKEIKLLNSKL